MSASTSRLPAVLLLGALSTAVLLSASCGCGGGSVGPPSPATGSPPAVEYNPDYRYDWYEEPDYDPSYRDTDRSRRWASDWDSEFSRERWCLAQNFVETMDHERVIMGAEYNMEDWGRLYFLPARPANAPVSQGLAYAVYAIPSYGFDEFRTHLQLYWQELLTPLSDVWVGVRVYSHDQSWWDWSHPDATMRFDLQSLWQYQAPDSRATLYVAVVVGGDQQAILEGLVLRESRW
jgi:hypothetical protein